MPFPPINAGTTAPIAVVNRNPAPTPSWYVYNNDTSTLIPEADPQGWNVAAETPDTYMDITVPLSYPDTNLLTCVIQGNNGIDQISCYISVIAAPPPPVNKGWDLRKINLPFRRHRPSPNIKP